MRHIIAFQGTFGAFADLACRASHPEWETLPVATFEDVFDAVLEGRAERGMIPLENSEAGRVAEIHQLLPQKQVCAIAEHFQPVAHHLWGPKGATLAGVKEAYSHPQALMQCRKNLKTLGLSSHATANTALAAEMVAKEGNPSKAALASSLAGELYGLTRLREHMEDSPENATLFLAISKDCAIPAPNPGKVITTLLFTLRNQPVALYKALGGFATNRVDLLKIESYIPGGVSRRAEFLISVLAHPEEKGMKLALEELAFYTEEVRTFGVYLAHPLRFQDL